MNSDRPGHNIRPVCGLDLNWRRKRKWQWEEISYCSEHYRGKRQGLDNRRKP